MENIKCTKISISLSKKNVKHVENNEIISNDKKISSSLSSCFINMSSFDLNQPKENNEDPPNIVKANYKDDLNIIKIHEAISIKFGSLLGKIPEFKNNIKYLEKKLNSSKTIIDKEMILEDITNIKNEIKGLQSGALWNEYINKVKHLLEEYIPLASNKIKGIVLINKDKNKENSELIYKRLIIINNYLEIAKNYINIDILWNCDNISRCPCCNIPFEKLYVNNDTGFQECDCGYIRETLSKISTFKDMARVSFMSKNTYDDLETFEHGLDKYEGKIFEIIPEDIYKKLDEYFILKKHPSGEYVRSLPLLKNGKKPNTSIKLLVEGLFETGNSKYYTYINYIGYHYWGWKLPDISHIRDVVKEKYLLTQKVYERIKTRESSLNINIRIYLHLKAEGYQCELDDFKILTSRDSLEYHHKMWKIMCEETGVLFTDLI